MNLGIPSVPISLLLIGGELDGQRVMVRIGSDHVDLPHQNAEGATIKLTYRVEALRVDGATFYLGLTQGQTITDAFLQLFTRYSACPPPAGELNPEHPMTAGLRGQWHKLLGLVMWKTGILKVTIDGSDIVSIARGHDGDMPAVIAEEKNDKLTLRLLSAAEAMQLVRDHEAKQRGGQG